MSAVNVNDVQFVPSNNGDQLQQSKNDVITDQPPPSYAGFNNQTIGYPNQNPMSQPYIIQNGQLISIVPVNTGMNVSYPNMHQGNIVHIRDYKIWSIFNLLCCGFVFGAFALYMSSKTRSKLRCGDIQGARDSSKQTAILNTLSTITGIIVIITVTILQVKGIVEFLNCNRPSLMLHSIVQSCLLFYLFYCTIVGFTHNSQLMKKLFELKLAHTIFLRKMLYFRN